MRIVIYHNTSCFVFVNKLTANKVLAVVIASNLFLFENKIIDLSQLADRYGRSVCIYCKHCAQATRIFNSFLAFLLPINRSN